MKTHLSSCLSLGGLLALTALLSTPTPAHADVLLTNYPAGLAVSGDSFVLFGDPIRYSEVGFGFTVGSQSYELTEFTARMRGFTAFDTIQLYLYSDNGGKPGTHLGASFTTVALNGNIQDVTFTPLSSVVLQANTPYWLNLHVAAGQGNLGASWGSYGVYAGSPDSVATGAGATHLGYGWGYDGIINPLSTLSHPFYRVSGNAVVTSSAPEPGTLLFLALGGTLVLLRRKR